MSEKPLPNRLITARIYKMATRANIGVAVQAFRARLCMSVAATVTLLLTCERPATLASPHPAMTSLSRRFRRSLIDYNNATFEKRFSNL